VSAERVDLWWSTTDLASPVAAERWRDLEAGELARARRLRPHRQRAYVGAHSALRRLLSAYTGTAPARLRLHRAACPWCGRPHGRPAASKTDASRYVVVVLPFVPVTPTTVSCSLG